MNVLLVDDEPLNLENCKEILNSFDIVDNIITFDNPLNVIKYIQSNSVDVAILDIEMPVMNGINLAKELQKISPSICIIFLTCYSQYALDAFAVDAIDYVLKPIDCNELKKALLKTIPYINQRTKDDVVIQTFTGFDVFINNTPLHFPRKKSKELLALLVDKRGSSISNATAMDYLWEDKLVDEKLKSNYKKCAYTLKKILKDAGISYILNDSYNSLCLNTDKVKCDYYDFLNNDNKATRLYNGSYMPEYSWAEETNGSLYHILSTSCPPSRDIVRSQ